MVDEKSKIAGARRRNGHKMTCGCHICENMKRKEKRGGYKEDIEKEKIKAMGGSKKKNGHKENCNCPICKNIRNAVGGSNDTVAEIDEKITDELDRAEKGMKKDTLELLEEGNYKSGIPPTLSDMEKGRAGYSKGGSRSRVRGKDGMIKNDALKMSEHGNLNRGVKSSLSDMNKVRAGYGKGAITRKRVGGRGKKMKRTRRNH
jgi:hypothetical protein